MRKGPALRTVALAPPGRLTEPHLPAITAVPQHKPVPTNLSTIFYLCP